MKVNEIYFPTLYDERRYVINDKGKNDVRVAEKIEVSTQSMDRDVLIETKHHRYYYTGIPYIATVYKKQEEDL